MNNIEIFVLDKEFKRIKAIRSFTSLQWTERYFAVGDFELHCDSRFLNDLIQGCYIYRKDKKTTGIIEYRSVDNVTNDVTVRGRFLEAKLMDRVIDADDTLTGLAEKVCHDLVYKFCMSGSRAISYLEPGQKKGLGEEVSIQRTGKTVYEVIQEILSSQDLSFRIFYRLEDERMFFEVYKGTDRTQSQNENAWCVFSSAFYNILSEKYESSGDTRNVAYVIGNDNIKVVVNNIKADEIEIKELYVDAKDIRREDGMSVSQYNKLLHDRGISKLAEYNIEESVECEIDVNNTAFFELGDKCTYIKQDLGLVAEGRVTEIYEIFEENQRSTNIKLGKEQLTIIQKIKREGK